jgi:hypothetical protein
LCGEHRRQAVLELEIGFDAIMGLGAERSQAHRLGVSGCEREPVGDRHLGCGVMAAGDQDIGIERARLEQVRIEEDGGREGLGRAVEALLLDLPARLGDDRRSEHLLILAAALLLGGQRGHRGLGLDARMLGCAQRHPHAALGPGDDHDRDHQADHQHAQRRGQGDAHGAEVPVMGLLRARGGARSLGQAPGLGLEARHAECSAELGGAHAAAVGGGRCAVVEVVLGMAELGIHQAQADPSAGTACRCPPVRQGWRGREQPAAAARACRRRHRASPHRPRPRGWAAAR